MFIIVFIEANHKFIKSIPILANSTIIMLTMNLWPEVGLCNGATGKVIDIIYAENSYPPMVLIAVVVIETQKY